MKLLIIVPAYNEEKSIERVIRSVKEANPEADVLVVNDGSRDRTSEFARSTGQAIVVDLPVNLGIGGAVQTGYVYAHRNGYDIAVQIDGDGQHDPAGLGKIVEAVASDEADCCIGSRFVEKTAYRGAVSRRLGIQLLSWLIKAVVGIRVTDPTSGFRAVNRRVIEQFVEYYSDDYPEVEAIVFLTRKGYRVREVSVEMHNRTTGRSSITPLKSAYYMLKVSLVVIMTRMRNIG